MFVKINVIDDTQIIVNVDQVSFIDIDVRTNKVVLNLITGQKILTNYENIDNFVKILDKK